MDDTYYTKKVLFMWKIVGGNVWTQLVCSTQSRFNIRQERLNPKLKIYEICFIFSYKKKDQ